MLKTLTNEQRADIDARILAGEIIEAISRIKTACGVTLRAAMDLHHARYLQLRRDRWIELRSRVVDLLKMDQLAGAADFQPPSMLLEQRIEPPRTNVAQLRPAAAY